MLGRGTSGQVYRAKDQKTGEVCALKFVRYKSERDMAFAGILQEALLFDSARPAIAPPSDELLTESFKNLLTEESFFVKVIDVYA